MSVLKSMKLVVLLICVLLGVAFVTLFERKFLGSIQIRKGPSKTGSQGILQPMSDGLKLFTKETSLPLKSNTFLFMGSPVILLSFSLILWFVFFSGFSFYEIFSSLVFVIMVLGGGVYLMFGAGWASNSIYGVLGSIRSVAQTVSYEVSFIIIIVAFSVSVSSLGLEKFSEYNMWLLFLSIPLVILWFITSLAETARSPFDFSESESELVSGVNTEFSGGSFALFFLSEYSFILFMGYFFAIIFFGGGMLTSIKVVGFVGLFIWVRGVLPRMRYDLLMSLAWVVMMPSSLVYFFFFLGLKMIS